MYGWLAVNIKVELHSMFCSPQAIHTFSQIIFMHVKSTESRVHVKFIQQWKSTIKIGKMVMFELYL